MHKILVLGGTGFLGKQVMRQLAEKGFSPISLSRREGTDICQPGALEKALREHQPDIIINCAAHVGSVQYAIKNAAVMIHDNMQIVVNIYDAVQRACPHVKIINPISNCSYPGDANIQSEEGWEKGAVHDSVLAYASVRRMIYAFAECYRKQYGIKSVNWLIANAYGPGDYTDPNKVHALNGILIRLLQAQRKGDTTFEIWGTGTPIREWVYIEDVASILVDSLDIDEQTKPLNFAQKKGYSITEIATLGAQALNYRVELRYNTSYADGAPTKILDDHAFRAKYPSFAFTPLSTGIQNTIYYYTSILV